MIREWLDNWGPRVKSDGALGSEGADPAKGPRVLDLANILLLVAFLIAIALVFFLHNENSKLRTASAHQPGTLAGPPEAEVGDIALSFDSVGVNGEAVRIGPIGGEKCLLYIFSPSCEVCAHEIPQWNRLAEQALAVGDRVFGISLDGPDQTKAALVGKTLMFPLSLMPDMATRRAYRTVAIPEVVVTSPTGRIEWVHYGYLDGEALSAIQAHLGITH